VLVPAPGDPAARPDSVARSGGVSLECVELSGGELHGLPEARGFAARATVGSSVGCAAVSVGRLGGDLYRETAAGVAVAWPLGPALVAEVGCRLLSLGAAGVPERAAVAFDAGVASRVLGRIVVAARWRNVGEARIGGSPVAAGSSLAAALALDGITVAGSLDLDPAVGASFAAGSEVCVGEWLRFRGGVSLDPQAFGAGVGIGRERGGNGRSHGFPALPVVDLAVTWHPELGGSAFATITFRR
jgi:hypothetical protein